jgi:subtilisin family serine protease
MILRAFPEGVAAVPNRSIPRLGRVSTRGTSLSVSIEVDEVRSFSALRRDPTVKAVAPSMPMKLIRPFDAAGKTDTGITWGVRAIGADSSPFDGKGTVVAILDTGIDAKHPAFAGVELIEKDFTGEGTGDTDGHGTHCAGTVFGRTTAGLRIGVAPGITKALIAKVLGARNGGSSDMLGRAIQWAIENGANVISMSLGIDFPGMVEELRGEGLPLMLATSKALEGYRLNLMLFERLVELIRANGEFGQPAVVVAAAGNESRTDEDPILRIAVAPPAVADGIVSVAALRQTNSGLDVAPFSNRGATVSAPGVQVASARAGGGLATLSGTSMATPHVAGVAALWVQQIRQTARLTEPLIKARLIASASTNGFKVDVDSDDIGGGMIRAPQA